MRRGLVMGGFWVLGVVFAVALAFAAVGRVAHGVAPRDTGRLSQRAIHEELSAHKTSPSAATSPASTGSSSSPATTSSTRRTTGVTSPTVGPSVTSTSSPASATVPPPPDTAVTATTTTPNTPTTKTTPVAPHNTVTASQGGTIFTRCSGPESIVFVAALPRTGYERTVDIEYATGIQQSFANGTHVSKIEAECSNGVVHAQVEEEADD